MQQTRELKYVSSAYFADVVIEKTAFYNMQFDVDT
jgi:hypothetical protein